MPLYEYECRKGHRFEAIQKVTERPLKRCEVCAASAKRAISREAYAHARTLGLRALELRPTLGARYIAARAAWRLQDWASVEVEMSKVRDQAREQDH